MPAIPAPDDTTTAPMRCSASVSSSSRTVALGRHGHHRVALGTEHGHDQHRVLLGSRHARAQANSLARAPARCPRSSLVVALASLAAACVPPSEPAQNGRLPDSALTTVTPTCRTANDVADPLRHLLYTAWLDGVPLVQPETQSYVEPLPGTADGSSRATAASRCSSGGGTSTASSCNCGYAAVPGTSVHGWGRAVDFEDGPRELTFSSTGYQWLQANAARFGFVHPAWAEPDGSSPEAWHWEHA